jgi:LPXTG-motif cell wall-anchored protein
VGSQAGQLVPKSNTGLYIALGIGGIALIGALIYVVSKKK